MKINKKSAPQKRVLEIVKVGTWGQVEYLHKLECGHTESRKRHAGSLVIACTGCVKADQMNQELKTIFSKPQVFLDTADIHDPVSTEIATLEQDIGRTRASLAKALGVSVDDVELIVTEDESGSISISQAMVFMGPSTINNLIKPIE